MRNRKLCAVLALILVLSTLFSCTPAPEGTSVTPPGTSPTAPVSQNGEELPSIGQPTGQPRKFTIFTSDVNTKKLAEDSAVYQQVKELYNVEFEWIIPSGDANERLGIMLAGNEEDLPDLIYFSDRTMMQQYINAGKLIKMNDYLEAYAPEVLDVNFASFKDRISSQDGSIYFLPRFYNADPDTYNYPENTNAWWLKAEFFEQNDLWDMLPAKTFDDMTAIFRKVKELTNQIPLGLALGAEGRLNDIVQFGIGSSGLLEADGFVLKDGEFTHAYETAEMKDYFKWLNSLNQEGLVDPESPLLSIESLKEKIINEQVFSSINWGYWTIRGQYDDYWRGALGQGADECEKIMFFQVPAAEEGIQQTNARSSINGYTTGTAVTVNMKDPADFFIFYALANTEEGHFNIMGTVNWEDSGDDGEEGYNFMASKEPLENGKYSMGITDWTWDMWDSDGDWNWKWGFESLIEFTYNNESNIPGSKYDITSSLNKNNDVGYMDEVWTRAGEQNGKTRWDNHRSRWQNTAAISALPLSNDALDIRAQIDIVRDRLLPRVIMAASDAEFEAEWANFVSELQNVGIQEYIAAGRAEFEARQAAWAE